MQKNPDIILMDIQMPIMNGYEAKIREFNKDVIITQSAFVFTDEAEKQLKLVVTDTFLNLLIKAIN
jgi:CheY-like chemotaxis protein